MALLHVVYNSHTSRNAYFTEEAAAKQFIHDFQGEPRQLLLYAFPLNTGEWI